MPNRQLIIALSWDMPFFVGLPNYFKSSPSINIRSLTFAPCLYRISLLVTWRDFRRHYSRPINAHSLDSLRLYFISPSYLYQRIISAIINSEPYHGRNICRDRPYQAFLLLIIMPEPMRRGNVGISARRPSSLLRSATCAKQNLQTGNFSRNRTYGRVVALHHLPYQRNYFSHREYRRQKRWQLDWWSLSYVRYSESWAESSVGTTRVADDEQQNRAPYAASQAVLILALCARHGHIRQAGANACSSSPRSSYDQ